MSREERVVSGAERTQDKRARQGAQAVAAARSSGGGSRRGVIAGIAIIVVLIVVVGGRYCCSIATSRETSARRSPLRPPGRSTR